MNNQILDDLHDESQPVVALWKYRVIGIFRMLVALVIVIAIILNIIDSINSSVKETQGITYFIGSLIGYSLFILPLIYHINQGYVELVKFKGFSEKRRFRIGGIVFNLLFALGFIVAILSNVVSPSEMKGQTIQLFTYFASALLFLSILIVPVITDIRYSRTPKDKESTD